MSPLLPTLVRRDLVCQRRTLRGLGLMVPLLFLLGASVDQLELVAPLLLFQIAYGFVIVATHHDDANQSYRLLFSMPIRRRDVVDARYLSFVGVCVGSMLVLAVAQAVLASVAGGWGFTTDRMSVAVLVSTLGAVFGLVGLVIPILFRDGVLGAGLALRVLPLIVIGAALSIEWLVRAGLSVADPARLEQLGAVLGSLTEVAVAGIAVGGGGLVLAGSYVASRIVMARKQL